MSEQVKNLIEIKDLHIGFREGKSVNGVVHGLNLNIAEGECLGVVGESGSGKSISSLSLLGLLPKSSVISQGSISYFGNGEKFEIVGAKENQLQKIRGKEIAMIFQEPMSSLNPVIKCGEQVAEALRLHKGMSKAEAKEKTIEWFNEVKLPRAENIYSSYPHQLSGGQKQRVMIAMAMCCEPKLLIADEPTTALDVTVQNEILKLISQLQKDRNMSVIFISHDLGVVSQIADRIAVMQAGKKVEESSAKDIFLNASDPYTKGLIACRPPENYRLKKLPTVADFLKDPNYDSKLGELKVSAAERESALKKVHDADQILKVESLKTYFPIQKGIFRKTVDHVRAVDDVSFEVKKGETLGLVGESGCGKTTLGRSILQLVPPTEGSVFFKGNQLVGIPESEMRNYRKQMQIIFQDPYSSLNPRMTIGNAIVEPMMVHGIGKSANERKEMAVDLMETVGLHADHFRRYPHEFSGGQRQRVCIARALALSPEFIICDESVSALDVSVQAQVLNLLNELKEKHGFTYIFISHDLSVIKYMSDRVMVMNNGKIVEEGEADALYNNPKHPYTQKLLASIPRIEYLRA
ncbi:MAG: ABC transporter ATP-binding protein [Flavobacteriales bacterium]|nr:ABC transporter ATP-binding protein [Flavobacteriales bacterium]